MHFTLLFASVFLASQAFAAIPLSNPLSRGLLLARQSGDDLLNSVPEQCRSDCTLIATSLATCSTDNSCVCTDTNGFQLGRCLNCIIQVGASSVASSLVVSQAKKTVDQFYTDCTAEGYPVSRIILEEPSKSSSQITVSAASVTGAANPTAPTSTTTVGAGLVAGSNSVLALGSNHLSLALGMLSGLILVL
ncbi:hypothetical protein BDQ12DRAFT_723401 [Crucibulum laeve]|uniref:Extracellular membrane protein CFEM domain-containing protein n=1 Tax=Crucibulum laeve TaxID=68775 RepID=A0A5C3M2H0_9AGAR|nr:hypothetical protein BDQ12DRAFT_723401 [Crucibulum laeve]